MVNFLMIVCNKLVNCINFRCCQCQNIAALSECPLLVEMLAHFVAHITRNLAKKLIFYDNNKCGMKLVERGKVKLQQFFKLDVLTS